MPVTLLVVDDQPSVRTVLRDYFTEAHYRVLTASNGQEGLVSVKTQRPDVVLLDLLMPEMDGHTFLKEVRRTSEVPVLMLTARAEETDRIIGLELGADDYIPKPFSVREVKARVQAVLRRSSRAEGPDVVRAGDIVIDRAARQVEVAGQPVELTRTEFDLLALLAASPGRVFTRGTLLNMLERYDGAERTVDVYVRNLRAKIEPDPAAPRYIETVLGVGYRLNEARR